MLFLELEVTNYRNFLGTRKFTFDNGLNLIIANNGAGKSTIMEAISYLLFNTGDAPLLDMCNWDSTTFSAECKFRIGADVYLSQVKYQKHEKSATTERYLFKNDFDKYIGKDSEAVEILNSLLDPDLVPSALFSRQGKNSIIDIKDAERRELLKKLKELDFSDKVFKLESQKKEVQDQLTKLEAEISILASKEYKGCEVPDLPFLTGTYDQYKDDRDQLRVSLQLFDAHHTQKCQLSEEKADISEDQKTKRASIDRKTQQKEKYEKTLTEEIDFSDFEEKLVGYQQSLQKVKDNFPSEVQKIEEKYDTLIQEKEIEKEGYSSNSKMKIPRLPAFEDTSFIMQSAISKLKSEIVNTQNKIVLIESGKCDKCGHEYHGEEQEAELIKLKTEQSTIEATMLQYETDLCTHQTEKQAHESARTALEENKRLKDKAISQMALIDNQISSFKNSKESSITEVQSETNSKIERLESEIKSTTQNVEHQKEVLKEKKVNAENFLKEFDSQVTSLKQAIQKSEIKMLSITRQLAELEEKEIADPCQQIDELTVKIKGYETAKEKYQQAVIFNDTQDQQQREDSLILKEKVEEAKKKKAHLSDIIKSIQFILKDFPNFIISEGITDLEDRMNDFIEGVYSKPLSVELNQVRNSIKMLYGTGRKVNVKDSASGAEKSIIQLSFINSFNQDLELGCIWMDEIDAYVSSENSENLFQSLINMQSYFEQSFVVTHNNEMKTFMIQNTEANIIEP